MTDRRALTAVLAGATVISFSAIFFRLSGADPVTGGFFRLVYAIPALVLLARGGREDDRRSPRARWLAVVAGVFLGADIIAWQSAIDQIGAGLATLLANSQVVLVPFATWLLLRERPGRRAITAMPPAIIGLTLITGLGRADSYGAKPLLGVMLGVLAAVLYSGFLIAFRRANRALAPQARPLLEAVAGAGVFVGIAGMATGSLVLVPTWPAHGWLLALALGPQVVGWMLISHGLPRLPAATSSFAVVLQPVLTMVWGAIFLAEFPSAVQLTGALLVLAAITIATRPDR